MEKVALVILCLVAAAPFIVLMLEGTGGPGPGVPPPAPPRPPLHADLKEQEENRT